MSKTQIKIPKAEAKSSFMFQWIIANQQNQQLHENIKRKWSKNEIIVLRCIEDALFHFICSMSGFLAFRVSIYLFESLTCTENLDSAISILLIFSFLFGIIGISGQLPPLIQLGKFPKVN